MNHSLEDSPLIHTDLTKDKIQKWSEAQRTGQNIEVDVYGKPTAKQLKELENVRNLSKELQDNLQELEKTVRVPDIENQAMNPTAAILDYSDDHEFMATDFYTAEDQADAKEEEKRQLTKGKGRKTAIQQFYKDQCVFLTGGSGFLGKVTIEKLLRSCGDVDTIYVLIRSKKGKDARTRIHELLDDILFDKAHEANPKGIHKVVPIVGDMTLPGLGLTEEDRKTLVNRVSIIINGAATVRFDEKLSISASINVRGTKEVIKLAKECKKLKAFTHISTAFSNARKDIEFIDEKFYDPPFSVEALEALANIKEDVIEKILPDILGQYPNTYCLTKAIAESAIKCYAEGLPVCIVRPAVVISTYDEPIRSWTDSLYGPTGLIIGAGTGVLRTMMISEGIAANMVPVDLCVNAVIASAWRTAQRHRENQTSDIPIYNYVSSARNKITWPEFVEINHKNGIHIPSIKSVWYYGLTVTSSLKLFYFYNFFLHYIPALLIDVYCTLTRRNRFALKLYTKMMKIAHILFYFVTREWKFTDNNVVDMWNSLSEDDKTVFPFDIAQMSWEHYLETFIMGLRVYVVKDDLSTLPEARKKWWKLYIAHQILKALTLAFVLLLCFYFYKVLCYVYNRL